MRNAAGSAITIEQYIRERTVDLLHAVALLELRRRRLKEVGSGEYALKTMEETINQVEDDLRGIERARKLVG